MAKMTREAAIELLKGRKVYVNGKSAEIQEKLFESGFKAGANWRIDSVWHSTNERPENDKIVLVITKASTCFICGPNNRSWTEIVRDFRITKWAYVEDLVPTEDEK